MSTPYSERVTNEWYHFDPNVHYYYDEQGGLHYYDPNTNLECDYTPPYNTSSQQQQQQQSYYAHNVANANTLQQSYTSVSSHQQQQQQQDHHLSYAEITSSRQATPDVLLPCPEPTCAGENKPSSKFCEECGKQIGAFSRSVTPAISEGSSNNNNNNNMVNLSRAFSNHQIQDNNSNYSPSQYHLSQEQQQKTYIPSQTPLQRPPTAPVYSTSPLDSVQNAPLYHPPSAGSTAIDTRMYQNGVQHQSMQDLRGLNQYNGNYNNTHPIASNSTIPATHSNNTTNNNVYQLQQQQPNQTSRQTIQQPAVDPLNRAQGCPIVTFGFGGKMMVTFPRTVTNYYSSTVKPQAGPIKLISLKAIVKEAKQPQLPQKEQQVKFPGPILFDSKMNTKQKKKEVENYINSKVEEFEKIVSSLMMGSLELYRLQAKIILYKLLKVMVETEGNLNDKAKMDEAILNVLRPTIASVEESHFSLPSYNNNGHNNNATPATEENDDLSDFMLSKIEQYLLYGDRKGAVNYAIQEDLWAHALIISSCVDKDLWQNVIAQFVDREMNATPEMKQNRKFNNIAGNNQALRVMYSLFSGAGTAAMNEFIKTDVQHVNTPYGLRSVTPQIELSQLAQWRETLAVILANRTPRDLEALTAFGDIMKEQGWIEVAHICYLLSPQNSVHSGIDTVDVRLTLVGSNEPTTEAFCLSEIFEFAKSLHNAGSTMCLPFLQGYKIAHAWILADYGYLDIAERYHEAIEQGIKSYTKGSPYFNAQLVNQVTVLGSFLENANGRKPGADSGSWLKPKFQKNTLTSLWGTLEGSLTKFVSGGEAPPQEPAPPRRSTEIMGRRL